MKFLLATLAVVILSLCIHFAAARDSTRDFDSMDITPRQNTTDPCIWVFNKTGESGHVYNLTAAKGAKDYNVTYQGTTYIVNMCTPTVFQCKTQNSPTGQRNSIGCQPGAAVNSTYSIGQFLQSSGVEIDGKYLQLNYSQGTPMVITGTTYYRRMIVKLQCGSADPGNWEMTNIVQANFFLTFTSKWACPVGSGPGPSPGGGGSTFDVGFIIIIAAVGALVLYFVIGAIVCKFVLKKEGIEIIPNVGFWTELPSLIKDGFLFVYYKIRGRGYSSV